MPNNDTLLAYLVASFPGNTENIATEALGHIFERSDASVEALNDVIKSGVRGVNPITTVRTQVIHADGTRPDLVGFDESGLERVLIEVKFWADLTANQPNGYLNRLPDDAPAVLAFLVPEERVQPLWPQLRLRAEREYGTVAEVDSERKCLRIGDGQRHLMIVSWGAFSIAWRPGPEIKTSRGWNQRSGSCEAWPSSLMPGRSSLSVGARNSGKIPRSANASTSG